MSYALKPFFLIISKVEALKNYILRYKKFISFSTMEKKFISNIFISLFKRMNRSNIWMRAREKKANTSSIFSQLSVFLLTYARDLRLFFQVILYSNLIPVKYHTIEYTSKCLMHFHYWEISTFTPTTKRLSIDFIIT